MKTLEESDVCKQCQEGNLVRGQMFKTEERGVQVIKKPCLLPHLKTSGMKFLTVVKKQNPSFLRGVVCIGSLKILRIFERSQNIKFIEFDFRKLIDFLLNTRKQPHHKWRGFFLGLRSPNAKLFIGGEKGVASISEGEGGILEIFYGHDGSVIENAVYGGWSENYIKQKAIIDEAKKLERAA